MEKKKTGRSIKEKAARMPEIRELKWDQIIPAYLKSVESQNSESAKSQRFLLLLNDFFGLQPGFIEDYVSGIEKYIKVKQKDRILKGRVDDLFGNLVIEFERNLEKKEIEAKEQLRKYIACLWSQEIPRHRTPYLCVASDGIGFTVYSPTIGDSAKTDIMPDEVRLEVIEQVDLSAIKPQEVYYWLDRYFIRKEILTPKTENIVKDFGVKSHAFQIAGQTLLSLWHSLKAKPEFMVVYEGWEKYLRIVYGTSIAEEELFIRHTYLATLAKLMAWSRLTEEMGSIDRVQIASVLEGQFFKDRGIENFLEEDFFSWVARKDAKNEGMVIARKLLSLLQNYNLRELSEDVLKGLYQELVDPKTRHDLGEYYTPDWLAHRMIQKVLRQKKDSSILDPACGSGTFLYLAIHEKREYLGNSAKTLEHILNSVVGVDIHPLAVIVAKTNYILALGDLLKKRKGKISLPIYLSDTIRLPEREVQPTLWMQIPSYRVNLAGELIYLPEELINEPSLYDEAIDAAEEYAVQNAGKQITKEQFLNFLRAHHSTLAENDAFVKALFRIAEILKAFIDSNRDTIWAFMLKNIYKPLFMKGKFDIVVGNPPWLSYRYVEQLDYQKFLKEQITQTYELLSGKGELITHLELGTLFFVRTAHLYLKEHGTIAFVLPRGIFTADQHNVFREGTFTKVGLPFKESWDLEDVKPLFNKRKRYRNFISHSWSKIQWRIATEECFSKRG
jgi:methylase of polypeptide subunit release factors